MIDKFIVHDFSYDVTTDTLSAVVFTSVSPNQDDEIADFKNALFTYVIEMNFSRNTAQIRSTSDDFEANIAYLPMILVAYAKALEAEQAQLDHTHGPDALALLVKTFSVEY
jgi:hypothetical protein